MKTRNQKLDEYRLASAGPYLGLKWQDKRNGEPDVYVRHFGSESDLLDFLVDTFGKKTALLVMNKWNASEEASK